MRGESFACAANAWREHQSELKGYLIHRLADPALAEDLLQEILLKALRHGKRFCSLDNPRAWLFQAARNAQTDHLRLTRASVPLTEDLADEESVTAPVDALAGCLEQVLSYCRPRIDLASSGVATSAPSDWTIRTARSTNTALLGASTPDSI